MKTFNTKSSVYLLIAVAFLMGFGTSLMIFLQKDEQWHTLKTSAKIAVLLPMFFVVIGFRLLFSIKKIQVVENTWSVKTVITGKTITFSKADVDRLKSFTTKSFRFQLTTENCHIYLKDGTVLRFSSRQIKHFNELVKCAKRLN